MGCDGNCNRRTAGASTGNCVRDTVRRILEAQQEVAGVGSGNGCKTSCDQSIEDLLSPSRRRPMRHTTIPFMLTCKDGCSAYFGSGFTGISRRTDNDYFHCVESPIFKVRGFLNNSNHCVQLELLTPIYAEDGHGDDYHHHGKGSVCGFFGNKPIENFCHTGVCITVDLNCFCGITCLDPVTPEN